MKTSRKTNSRREAILVHLKHNGKVLVDDLAALFETTPQTIRKDLNAMSEAGQVMRIHGGATLLAGSEYVGYEVRREIAGDAKAQIGAAVAQLIPNNATVVINSGTTTAAAAQNLRHHVGLKIVTDSVVLASEIRSHPGAEVYVPAGAVRAADGVILGGEAVDFLRRFHADIALIGVAAIADDGTLLDYDLREAQVVRTIIANARNIVLAADSSKFGRAAPVAIGHLSQIGTFVTDAACPAPLRGLCETHKVGLVEAGAG